MKIKGEKIHSSMEDVAPKCTKYLLSIRPKKKIDMADIGSQSNNAMVDLLRCESRVKKQCIDIDKAYMKCHSSVMGTGSYNGQKTCNDELLNLYKCLTKSK